MIKSTQLLNSSLLKTASLLLAQREPAFKKVIENFGMSPLWDRPAGFPTLVQIILEQQVSLSSAKAAFDKLNNFVNLNPENFLSLSDDELKKIGFSRQKTKYCRTLAEEILYGTLDLKKLNELSDNLVKKTLMKVKGIGHWTSDIYLLMVLLRPDVWPHGDRALAVAAFEVLKLDSIPDYEYLRTLSQKWKPWRSVAARILWHHYLSTHRKRYSQV